MKVGQVMTYFRVASPYQTIRELARTMVERQHRHLPVLSRDNRLVGILLLGDSAIMTSLDAAAVAIGGILQPGGEHSQTDGPRT
jgi:predicted transcriptional regulator